MNLMFKIVFAVSSVLLSTSTFAANLLGNVGYSQISTFSDNSYDNTLGTVVGYNLGASLLFSMIPGPISPVVGAGLDYMSLSSNNRTLGVNNSNTYTSAAGAAHGGLGLSAPGISAFLLANLGYGLSDSLKIVSSQGGTTISTSTISIKNHIFYGGTLNFLMAVAPLVKVGIGGIYNIHSATFENSSISSSTNLTYNELSGNLLINFSL